MWVSCGEIKKVSTCQSYLTCNWFCSDGWGDEEYKGFK